AFDVSGDLTIKGITKPVDFEVSIYGDKATATLKVDRTEFDVKYGSGIINTAKDQLIYDEFDLVVDLQMNGFSLNVYNTFSALGKGSAEAQEIAPLLFFPSILQGGHIDDKTILHIPLEQPLIGRIDVLHPDQFDIRYDIVLPT